MTDALPLAYRLDRVALGGPEGPALEPTTFSIRDRAVTAIVGPAGGGKSQLLRALSGRSPLPSWTQGGLWEHRGTRRGPDAHGEPFDDVGWFEQRRRGEAGTAESTGWRDLFELGRATLLLDEPERRVPAAERGALIEALRCHAESGAAVVVTHDLAFARSVADEVFLLCAGRFRARDRVAPFFERPRSALAEHFVRQGNCWPDAPAPTLPPHFQWIIPGRLAGMGVPGLMGPPEPDLKALAEAGISLLVSLTERPYPAARLSTYGIEPLHFPIKDMGVPGLGATTGLCGTMQAALRAGRGVAVHCRAGLGRTGTVLACLLLWMRLARSESVVEDLRRLGPMYVQSQAQHDFIRLFSDYAGL